MTGVTGRLLETRYQSAYHDGRRARFAADPLNALGRVHAGIELVHVPFKGEAAVVQHLPGNQDVVVYFGSVGSTLPHIQAGKMKPLAVSTARRIEQLPNVATLKEHGIGDFNESF